TFNLSIPASTRILGFFLERVSLGLFLHFEMIPDRLPEELRAIIRKFPKGSLQFEIGIQTWSPEVARLVRRRQHYAKVPENFRFAKFWDLYANSGNFLRTMELLRDRARASGSLFSEFLAFSRFLDSRHPQRYAIALLSLVESAWLYLGEPAREALLEDYTGRV